MPNTLWKRLYTLVYLYVSALLLTSYSANAQVTQTISATGSGSWTVPCGVTSVTVELWGAGGAGGGSSTNGSGGGGGGGGCYTTVTFPVTPGANLAYSVGAGGVGVVGANGTAGGSTTFDVYTALGGGGGFANAGGFGAGCTAAQNGVNGGASGGNGGSGQNGGAGGAGVVNGPGLSGTAPGGGGGGGERDGGTNRPGGAGGNGQIRITYTSSITPPNAGPDLNGCGTLSFSGNTPDAGWTGTWVLVAGTATADSPNDPNSTISGMTNGTCATFEWRFTQAGCPTMVDQVVVCVPLVCNDDPCNAFPLAVTNVTPGTYCTPTATLSNVGSTYSTGMPDPPCGYVNGPDLWYSVVVPADGVVLFNGIGSGTFDPMISVYEGGCNSLSSAGCVAPVLGGSQGYPLTYAGTPGSTIYVRVNEALGGDSPTGSFGLCAFSNSNPTTSQVLPGDTTVVSCGSSLNFYDPGGLGGTASTCASPPPAGNYSNNLGSDWVICPSDPSQYVQINFSQFAVESGFDKVIILSGDTVIAQWTGTQGAGDIVTSQYPGECLTVVLQSDYICTALGWEALVSCTTAVVAPQITTGCEVRNCTEGCGVWVCADGIYDTEAGAGAGIDEINEVTGGCWGASGEVATSWFYFTIATDGELAFEFIPSNSGHNLNFALYGPSTDGIPPCPLRTGESPVRCSFADIGGANTGMQSGETDLYEGADGNSFVAPLDVVAGETYALVVDVYQNGQPPTETQIDFTGVASLDCSVVPPVPLGVQWITFNGINQDDQNLLTWIVSSQLNNDYFTVEHSKDGLNWEVLGYVDGAGNSNRQIMYSFIDYQPYMPFSYYRIRQTDFNGEFSFSKAITVNREKMDGKFISKIFPNPTENYFSFMYNGNDTENTIIITIIDETGKIAHEEKFEPAKKNSGHSISTQSLEPGIYQVVFSQNNEVEIQKLSIVK